MSKAIINNKMYDTEKAELVVAYRRRVDMGPVMSGSDIHWTPMHDCLLYKTAKGNYFEHDGDTDAITPRDEKWARDLIRRLYPDKYIELFGEVEEA